jgi:predicted MPP superfamily phosphohydrolase
VRRRRATFIIIVQSILFAAHAFVYETWTAFSQAPDPPGISRLAIVFALLSLSFVAASLLAFRYHSFFVSVLYRIASSWLGILNYSVLAALLCWILYGAGHIAGASWNWREIALVLFALSIAVGVIGIVNASWTRVVRIKVKLPNLPAPWRGRLGALVSDTHFGPVRAEAFSRHIVRVLNRERPDVVFLAGDVYDGTAVDAKALAQPFKDITAPLGSYYVTGNHDEFGGGAHYMEALSDAGVHVLNRRTANVDGLQIVGVPYRDLATPETFESALDQAQFDNQRTSVLLAHAPNRLWEAEKAGISLQLCGHTHGGQFFPWTRVVSRVYGKFAYGLHKLGNMMVYTSCGAGTWGPPVRLGTNPEIVLIQFE